MQFFRREQRDVRRGKFLAQPQQGGRGHHGIAQPVRRRVPESRRGCAVGGWRIGVSISILSFWPTAGFHRRWTQNQFAGSRRTASSKRAVHVAHDFFRGARFAVFMCRDFFAEFQPPFRRGRRGSRCRCTARNDSVVRKPPVPASVEQSCPRNGPRKPAVLWSVRNPRMIPVPVHRGAQERAIGAALKKKATRTLAQSLQQAIERGLFQRPIGRGALEVRAQIGRTARTVRSSRNGRWRRRRSGAAGRRFFGQTLNADKFNVRAQVPRNSWPRF